MFVRVFGLCLSLLVSAVSLHAQQLFSANPNPVQPHAGLVALFGGEPSARVRQTTLNTNYFVNTFNNAQGDLTINLFPDVVVTSKRSVVTNPGQGRYTWRGTVEGANFYGRAVLAIVGNQIAGTVQKDGKVFLIRPVSDSVQVISEVNQTNFPDEAEPIDPDLSNARFRFASHAKASRPQLVKTNSTYTIKVMLVFPDGLGLACSGPIFPFAGWLRPLVELIYESNLNDVWNAFMTDTIIADVTIYCSTYVSAGVMEDDLDWVSTDATVATERDARNADLVSLLVSSGSYCGLGQVNEPVDAADDDDVFSVVKTSCGLSNYSLAHELGHNMGLDHDRYVEADGATSTQCGFGYVITVNGTMTGRDAMAYETACTDAGTTCPRIGAYSYDLTVSLGGLTIVFGQPCTDADAASNVRVFADAVPIVESFR
ncbi:MAG TPA: zinc-dependent metalloprotease family protein [Thermoanaerobaculia bacterium]|jgi:hypothetical protein|nr:zinc-dependent metalloprotease family protein [Thermoanaerobaculia bacterium]